MEEVRIEKLTMEDGRQAERHVKEEGYCDENQTRVVDLYVEPERPKHLAKRIVEKRRPCVFRREIETIDENGEVVDRKVESIDPEDKMELRSHIATVNTLAAQSTEDECDCPVTAAQLKDVMVDLADRLSHREVASLSQEPAEVVALQDTVSERVLTKSTSEISQTTWMLLMVVAAQLAGLFYIWVLM